MCLKRKNIVSPEMVNIGFAAKQEVLTFQKVNKGNKQIQLLQFSNGLHSISPRNDWQTYRDSP